MSADAHFDDVGAQDGGDGAAPLAGFGPLEVVATDLFTLWEIACDEQAAYAAVEEAGSATSVVRVAPREATKKLTTAQFKGRFVAVDDSRVYWTVGEPSGGFSYVRATMKSDGGAAVAYYPDGAGAATYSSLALKGTVLAFFSTTAGGRVFRGNTTGLGGFDVIKGGGAVQGLAIDGAYIYWVSEKGDAILRGSGADGGAIETFAKGSSITAIAVANGEVFWTSDDGELRGLPTSALMRTGRTIATGLELPRHLVVDSSRAYWVNTADGSISTVPLSGGPRSVLGIAGATGNLAVCANAVWFTNTAKGEILRMAKK